MVRLAGDGATRNPPACEGVISSPLSLGVLASSYPIFLAVTAADCQGCEQCGREHDSMIEVVPGRVAEAMHLGSFQPVIVGLALIEITVAVPHSPPQEPSLPFSCATFPVDASAAGLRDRFGDEHVETAPVPWGGAEGDYNEGTVLFGKDPSARIEIFWRDVAGKRNPEWVSVRDKRSRWQTPAGVTIGTVLQALEKLNGRPFRLLGFGTDVSGTVMSSSNGRLAGQDVPGCRVRLRLNVDWEKTEDGRSRLFAS